MSIQQRSVSELIRGSDFAVEPKKRSRKNFKKEKELDEPHTVPALVSRDVKDTNPHVPQYISSTPWYYYDSSGPTLKHQRPKDEKPSKTVRRGEWYVQRKNRMASKSRSRACSRCGAIKHDRKSSLEKPPKIPAKISKVVKAADDEKFTDLDSKYESKKDNWKGYYMKIYEFGVDESSDLDEAKPIIKEEKIEVNSASNESPIKIKQEKLD